MSSPNPLILSRMKKLKLNELEATRLSERQLSTVTGGYNCSCGCPGPSTTKDNKTANIEGGLQTPGYDVCDSIIDFLTVTWK